MRYQPPQPAEMKRRPWLLLALIPLVLLLGAAGAYFAFFAGRDEVTPATPDSAAVIVDDATPTLPPTPAPPTEAVPVPAATDTPLPPPTHTPELPPTDTPEPPPTDTVLPPTDAPPPTDTPDLGPERLKIGRSALDQPIEAVRFGAGERSIVLIGGLHAGHSDAGAAGG